MNITKLRSENDLQTILQKCDVLLTGKLANWKKLTAFLYCEHNPLNCILLLRGCGDLERLLHRISNFQLPCQNSCVMECPVVSGGRRECVTCLLARSNKICKNIIT